MKVISLRLPEWTLCPLFNGDESGISDEQSKELETFINDHVLAHDACGVPVDYRSHGFLNTNDMNNLAGEVYDVDFPKLYDKTRVYMMTCDPGHGWLKVSLETLKELGIEKEITSCSYMKGGFAYLEEDLDAPLFVSTLLRKHRVKAVIKARETNRQSQIRGYRSYDERWCHEQP